MRTLVHGEITGTESHVFECGRCKTQWEVEKSEIGHFYDDQGSHYYSTCPTCQQKKYVTWYQFSPKLQMAYEKDWEAGTIEFQKFLRRARNAVGFLIVLALLLYMANTLR